MAKASKLEDALEQLKIRSLQGLEAKTGLWLAGNEGMEKTMETTIMGYIGTSIRIPSFFIPS